MAASCIQATLLEKIDEMEFPPLGGHILIRRFSGVACLVVQSDSGGRREATIMNPQRLATVPALTVVFAGCVIVWVAGFGSTGIEDTAAAPIVERAPATPNARVADAFGVIPLNVTALLTNIRAELPAPAIEAKFDKRSSSNTIVAAEFSAAALDAVMPPDVTRSLRQQLMLRARGSIDASPPEYEVTSQQDRPPAASPIPSKGEHSYLEYYVYSESPPPEKPTKIAMASLRDVPLGTPVQEIERAAEAFDVDVNFMKAVAKIESDFNPRERTGSYIGLFQLSKSEFSKYGSGDILNPRDNSMAAAYKFATEAALFEATTHMRLTFANLYLIHQQGWEGAAEHLSHPQQIAWKSMCATHEGMTKGEGWCKRAIWGNTLPAVKHEWQSVDRLTSGAFVAMWRDRVDTLYARYPAANVNAVAAASTRSNSL